MRDSRHKEKGLGGAGAWWEGEGRRGWSEAESSHNLEAEALLLLLKGSLPLAGPAAQPVLARAGVGRSALRGLQPCC